MNKRKVIHLRGKNTYEEVLQRWLDRGYKVENLALSSCCTSHDVIFTDLVAVLVEEEQQK